MLLQKLTSAHLCTFKPAFIPVQITINVHLRYIKNRNPRICTLLASHKHAFVIGQELAYIYLRTVILLTFVLVQMVTNVHLRHIKIKVHILMYC